MKRALFAKSRGKNLKYSADGNLPKAHQHMPFLVYPGTFLCFQARRFSATRSSASDLTVDQFSFANDFLQCTLMF